MTVQGFPTLAACPLLPLPQILVPDDVLAILAGHEQTQVAAFAQQKGFRFAFETHHGYLHDLPSTAMRLVNAVHSSALSVLLDYANVIGFANAPSLEESIEIIGDSLFQGAARRTEGVKKSTYTGWVLTPSFSHNSLVFSHAIRLP